MNYGKESVSARRRLMSSAKSKVVTRISVTVFKLLLLVFVAVIVTGSCAVLGMVTGIIDSAPDISSVDVSPTGYATRILDSEGNETARLIEEGSNRIFVSIDKIPLELQRAFIAIEDERFYEHNGIDIRGILRAGMKTLQSGGLSQGASTITQQLLKNNVFNAYNESTIEKIKRKIQEQYLALKLETYMDKDKILENYLNTINLGHGYLGVQSAANGYFGKDVSELTLSECAVIASITQNPFYLDPIRYPDDNKIRKDTVLLKMYEQGYISKEQYDEAMADDVYSRISEYDVVNSENNSTINSYFTDALITELLEDLQVQYGYTSTQAYNLIYSGGLTIYSTQDSSMQKIADDVFADPKYYPANTQYSFSYYLTIKKADGTTKNYSHVTLQNYFTKDYVDYKITYNSKEEAQAAIDKYKAAIMEEGDTILGERLNFTLQPQISFTLMDQYTGEVKVIVGGRGEKTGNRVMNRATETVRQPGSAIKPLGVYGPALDTNAITLATPWDDAPYYYSGTTPKLVTNYEKTYLGLMSTRYALYKSRNVPAVKCLTLISPEKGFSYLEKLGLSTVVSKSNAINGHHDVIQAMALGGITKGLINIEMTAAYAAIFNGGVYIEPTYYTKVLDHDGNVIIDKSEPVTTRVFKETTCFLLIQAMRDAVDLGSALGAKFDGMDIAGKTGTTQTNGDVWFCGATPYYVANIWVGYDDNSELPGDLNRFGFWKAIMEEIHKDLPEKKFEEPEGIVRLAVCSQSGLLPVEGLCDHDPRGSQIVYEYFAEDNMPTEYCSTHTTVTICDESGEIASAFCPHTTEQIYIKKETSDTLLPDDVGKYPVADMAFAVTSEMLSKQCSIHSKNIIGIKPSDTQKETSKSDND
ncbi:MAG: transglycosylase domain-containing protein [Lachnospiraceae bacterium]